MPRIRTLRSTVSALLVAAALAPWPAPAPAQGLAGAFLAARLAGEQNDFLASTRYLERILETDPENLATLEGVTVSAFSAGLFDAAQSHAETLVRLDPESRIASMVLMSEGFARGDYDQVATISDGGAEVHPLIDGLARAWAKLGQGSMSEALDLLDETSTQEGMQAFALYCRALALALVGDAEGALAILEDPATGVSGSLNRRGYIAYAQLLGLVERFDDAIAMIDRVFAGSTDPRLADMRAAYETQQAVPFDVIDSPAQGMAEVYAVMASAMRSTQSPHEALIYAQAAVHINPALSDAQLLIGQLFEELEQPQMAAAAYERIPQGDVFAMAAQMGRAQVLEGLGQVDEAIAILTRTAADNPDSFTAQQVLADFLRRADRHDEAIVAYSRGLDLMAERGVEPGWQTYFSRAVSYERTGQWPLAEADFRTALEIEPDQPSVLNYLGYSLVERGENLDEALAMIERAVRGEPDSGYIVDSLAWALFRLGHYDQAVPHMERAVELAPTDPILNDHLGDVYWAVSRYREARFQWRRALSFGPNDDMDESRIRRKLEVGLDAVRAEEGLPPLHPEH
ncbi:MAG: tetratricopeptide repeat protein [Rhodobacter sp.]|nr:tetratricopeptide repeat protein [Paracoccaceae bacterium]MCC0080492.1 tetratricopeptide repeat protein [Rhodobacter sp.]